jgi:tRNA A-37 threonylcarbamoyl transferase component Bud32
MEATVDSLCRSLSGSGLLSADLVRGLQERWPREAKGSPADTGAFARWLVSKGVATKFQLGVLSAGRGEQLTLGKYKLLDRVARGRVAGVFKAVHSLGEVVAIKVLPPSKTKNPKIFARFQREARLAQRLNHPNVVRTFQLAEDEGVYYLVMEYLDGETLADVLRRRGPLPPDEAVYVTHQALLGLEHVHEQGLVHRDLSPENLLLVDGKPDDTRTATVKILDIGTGRATLDGDGEQPGVELTLAGDQLGTPEYQAPEQAADARNVDIRADLYSIGCVLFHALAGEPPFVDTKDRVGLIMRHLSEAPRSLLAVCPDAPPKLQGVLDRLLAKKPVQRFANPAEALKALAPFLPKVAQKAAGQERPELKAFLRWLQTETAAELELPPEPVAYAGAGRNTARRDLLADLAQPTVEVDTPGWLAGAEPETPEVARLRGANEFGIDLSAGAGQRSKKEVKTIPATRSQPSTQTLLIAALGVGALAVLLLIIVIVILLIR